jgi:hypothetical protein
MKPIDEIREKLNQLSKNLESALEETGLNHFKVRLVQLVHTPDGTCYLCDIDPDKGRGRKHPFSLNAGVVPLYDIDPDKGHGTRNLVGLYEDSLAFAGDIDPDKGHGTKNLVALNEDGSSLEDDIDPDKGSGKS